MEQIEFFEIIILETDKYEFKELKESNIPTD
jgi:hypothetical protein